MSGYLAVSACTDERAAGKSAVVARADDCLRNGMDALTHWPVAISGYVRGLRQPLSPGARGRNPSSYVPIAIDPDCPCNEVRKRPYGKHPWGLGSPKCWHEPVRRETCQWVFVRWKAARLRRVVIGLQTDLAWLSPLHDGAGNHNASHSNCKTGGTRMCVWPAALAS